MPTPHLANVQLMAVPRKPRDTTVCGLRTGGIPREVGVRRHLTSRREAKVSIPAITGHVSSQIIDAIRTRAVTYHGVYHIVSYRRSIISAFLDLATGATNEYGIDV